MRRLASLLAVGTALVLSPLATAPAAACPPPSEEVQYQCCQPPALVAVTLPDGTVVRVPDPFRDIRRCLSSS
jgi:hypothetical protein